ncbi:MAG TPA: cytochrome c oxidase assembly protein [Mycobacteriales bacterium]|nr:cytochrome c oxidase assembly protein [Mycobacteriales bacterium]
MGRIGLRRLAPALLVLGFAAAACGGGSGGSLQITDTSLGVTGGHAAAGDLSITHAYIPAPATPSLAAAYFTVTNTGASPDRLLRVSSGDFGSATLHRYATTSDGAERMVAVPGGAVVPAHGQLSLTPGSYHLMLQRPAKSLRRGMVEQLTLDFARAGHVSLAVPVVADTGLPGSGSTSVEQMPGMSMPATSATGATGSRAPPAVGSLPKLTVGRLFSSWSLHIWSALAAALLLIGYLLCWRAARRRGAAWQRRATASWCAAIAVLVFTTQAGLRVYDDALFWVHMVGHLLLVMIVPVLLVAGRPLDLVIAALPDEKAERIEAGLRGRASAVATNPGVGLVLYTAVIVGTHLTGFMNQMMLHPWLTGVEQLMYVVAGTLFFLPLVGDAPIRWKLSAPLRMAMLVVAMPVDTFTGVVLGQTDKYPWPMMAAMHPAWAPSLLTDLHAGGAVMWVGGDAIMAVMFGVAAVGWARTAGAGTTSELGGWLDSARANYQQDLVGRTAGADDAPPTSNPDSDEALAAYNEYLQRLGGRRG